jgi:hypothetical protein
MPRRLFSFLGAQTGLGPGGTVNPVSHSGQLGSIPFAPTDDERVRDVIGSIPGFYPDCESSTLSGPTRSLKRRSGIV